MTTTDWETLEAAYRATTYRVMLPGEWADVQIGQPLPSVLNALLQKQGQLDWAIVTADNPQSRQLLPAENTRRRQALEQSLVASGKIFYQTKHLPEDPAAWPVERGLFVLGLEPGEAVELGRTWGQHAVVAGSACDLDSNCLVEPPMLLRVGETA